MNPFPFHIRRKKHRTERIGPRPLAARLLLVGQPTVLLGLCDFAARLYAGIKAGEVGIMLRIGDDMEYIAAALVILYGGALLLDYMERRYAPAQE